MAYAHCISQAMCKRNARHFYLRSIRVLNTLLSGYFRAARFISPSSTSCVGALHALAPLC